MPEQGVVHVITGLSTGGAEHMLEKLVSPPHPLRFKSTVISLGDIGPVGQRLRGAGIRVEALGIRSGVSAVSGFWRLSALIRQIQPQLIQGWMGHGNLAATAANALNLRSTPVIWNIRMALDDLAYEKRATAAVVRAGALLSRFPDRIIYNSRRSAEQHQAAGYAGARAVVVPNGFDCGIFHPSLAARIALRQELGLSDDSLLIGQVGRFHPMKDHVNFLDAAEWLSERHPGVRFVLVGAGVDRANVALLDMLRIRGLTERVFLLGERSDVAMLTAALDVACLASRSNEGFPNVVGEAMASGIPCTVTDVGDAAFLVGDSGIVVPPRDPKALATAWESLVELGPEERRRLGSIGRQRVQDLFSIESISRQYEALYLDAIHEHRAAACASG